MPRLLVVEDERGLAETIARGLRDHGYAVDIEHDGAAAWDAIALVEDIYDLVVLDILIPGLSGLELCRRLRTRRVDVPVLMLTARDRDADIVAGLDAGADDYLVKPFAFSVLVARIRALLRRSVGRTSTRWHVGRIDLDVAERRVWADGAPVELTAKELAVLEALMRRPGAVLSKARLLELAWDREQEPGSNVVEVHIAALRRKLGDSAVRTVRGLGYTMRDEGDEQ